MSRSNSSAAQTDEVSNHIRNEVSIRAVAVETEGQQTNGLLWGVVRPGMLGSVP